MIVSEQTGLFANGRRNDGRADAEGRDVRREGPRFRLDELRYGSAVVIVKQP